MLSGVMFDLDGVLVDSVDRMRDALVAALATEDERWPPRQPAIDPSADFDTLVADHLAARPANAALATLDDTARALLALRAEREDRARVTAGVTLVEGARDAIALLASESRTAVVTRWRRADAEHVLALAGLDTVIRFVVAADDGPGFASTRVRYVRALARLRGVGTAHHVPALVAGPHGADAAQAAGAHPVVVGVDVLIAALTPARLAGMIAAGAPWTGRPSPPPPSRP